MRQTKLYQNERSAYLVAQIPADREGRSALLRAQKVASRLSDAVKMEDLMSIMTEEDLEYFIELFAKYTKLVLADKKPGLASVLADHFSGAGGYEDMVQWLAFCMGFNFGPFFAWLLGSGTKVKEALLQGKTEAESVPNE